MPSASSSGRGSCSSRVEGSVSGRSISAPLIEFFARRGAALVLLFILLHKIGDTLANLTLRLLLDDLGFTNQEIATYDVGFGFIAYLVGIFIGGAMYARFGLKHSVLASLVLMSVLLLKVSGVALLEKDIGERRPAYRDYIARTNAFFPGPRRAIPAAKVSV